ncbi:MAG: response regulator [Armatimonadetes bacterium]|nr:response regulator [Armatimonadota bacterium]
MDSLNGRILVVDDELPLRELCRLSLTAAGHEVTVAESAEQALEVFEPGAFDLLLTDLMMPGMSGLDLLKHVLEADPSLACVMITGSATIETAVEAIQLGAFNYVSKPFTAKELAALAEQALRVRRLRQEAERNLLLLHEEQSRVQTIVQSMVDGVLVTNREGNLVFYNPALPRLLQLGDKQPSVGEAPSAELFPPDLLSSMREALAETEAIRTAGELPGGPPYLSASVSIVRDQAGEALGTVAVIRDITEAKKLEEQMSAFASMVAHELRSPLAAITQYMDLILGGVVADDEQKLHEIVGRCRSRTGALAQLVNDLLDFSRLKRGSTRERTFAPVNIAAIVEETVEFAAQAAVKKQVTLSVELSEGLPRVIADRDEMVRLFTNLVDNAIKYNREGGSVAVRGHEAGAYVRLEIADTGLGIPKDQLGKIGDTFYRVKTRDTVGITGTGLGVSICKQIIEAHDGQLEIESEEGEGSTFRVLLPVAAT